MIPLAWLFAQWGLDMVDNMHRSVRGGHTYLLVAVDKFTKWTKAMPVTSQDVASAVNFFRSITCDSGPHSIIIDNGSNFGCSRNFA
jgi:hypothetical protein